MLTIRRIPTRLILRVEKYPILFFIFWSASICAMHRFTQIDVTISFTAVGTIGTAVAILLGFKNNAAYDRWWEARKMWGGIVNQSRSFASQLIAYVDDEEDNESSKRKVHLELVYRHLGYVNALRLQLRGVPQNADSQQWLEKSDPTEKFSGANLATQINHGQAKRFKQLFDEGWFESFRLFELMATNLKFFEFQGKAERINNTPLLRHYSYFTSAFVWVFAILLPFGFVGELGWLTLPLAVLISTIFTMLDRAGTFTEDPFSNDFNDVPLDAICRTIEIDMLQQIGVDLELKPIEVKDGVLM